MIYIPFLYGSNDGNPINNTINNTINYIWLVVLSILKNYELVMNHYENHK